MTTAKTSATKPLRTYKVWFSKEEWAENVTAKSASAARYRYFNRLELNESYGEMFRYIHSKSLGSGVRPSREDAERFAAMQKHRGLKFAKIGMTVEVDGKRGVITGSNHSLNLDVIFDGKAHPDNCHPHWRVKYFDNSGNLIKEYHD